MIVDVGGADGTVPAAILTAHPQLRGVLFDLPHVISDAPGTLARHGVEDRAECAGGDFLESVPPAGTPTFSPSSCTTGPTPSGVSS
jgi:hypothetical protein